ncbi:MAG TPA: SO2930 family diheme c-type cytochrome [Chryseosolibacter sp.]|nr:SO2930 family diheme c-type cytochrome [Chryseosolibacter sp.]
MRTLVCLILVTVGLLSFSEQHNSFVRKEKLSEYGFFIGDLAALNPAPSVIPYNVNTPLFSNYAEKLRFVKLPEGRSATYHDSGAFEFPEGTILIKNFYYPTDFRNPAKGRRILETRLLVREASGWQPYPYVWNEDQTEAYYDAAGETISVEYISGTGKKIRSPYVIPNKNQCKGCHTANGRMVPIGVNARQLNGVFEYPTGKRNQLEHWAEARLLMGLPAVVPALAVWDKPASGSLNDRARAYLDANCGHCHSRSGPANTSGLFLDIFETDPSHLGVFKAPVAAGRGAGDLQFDIKPGDPDHSIVIFRMRTTDPAIAMPEIGREQIHAEGVALIEEWIRKNAFSKN